MQHLLGQDHWVLEADPLSVQTLMSCRIKLQERKTFLSFMFPVSRGSDSEVCSRQTWGHFLQKQLMSHFQSRKHADCSPHIPLWFHWSQQSAGLKHLCVFVLFKPGQRLPVCSDSFSKACETHPSSSVSPPETFVPVSAVSSRWQLWASHSR